MTLEPGIAPSRQALLSSTKISSLENRSGIAAELPVALRKPHGRRRMAGNPAGYILPFEHDRFLREPVQPQQPPRCKLPHDQHELGLQRPDLLYRPAATGFDLRFPGLFGAITF
jgi:hypothetical protein